MTTLLKWAGVIALIAVIVLAAILFFPKQTKASFGAIGHMLAENYDPYLRANGGFYTNLPMDLGLNGTAINRLNTGQCFFAPSGTTIAASTTVPVDCQATAFISTTAEAPLQGVTLGDAVVVEMSTTTSGSVSNGISDTGCSASTTQGYITCEVSNTTGATYTWPTTGSASGTASYFVSH